MAAEPITIIGINPGTRYLGLAVMEGNDLKDWRTKVIKGKTLGEKLKHLENVLKSYMAKYRPTVVALKEINPSHSSASLEQVAGAIKRVVSRHGVTIEEYSLPKVKKLLLSQEERKSKRNLAKFIATAYPVLFQTLHRESALKNPYYIRMFEAVALASVFPFETLHVKSLTFQRTIV